MAHGEYIETVAVTISLWNCVLLTCIFFASSFSNFFVQLQQLLITSTVLCFGFYVFVLSSARMKIRNQPKHQKLRQPITKRWQNLTKQVITAAANSKLPEIDGMGGVISNANTNASADADRRAPDTDVDIDANTNTNTNTDADADATATASTDTDTDASSNGSHGDICPLQQQKNVMKRADYLSWGEYFMSVAILSSLRSKDPSTQVGACIVSSDQKIVGIGYNGFPNGCSDDTLPWARNAAHVNDTKYPYVCHAEMNAILNKNCADLKHCSIYVALFPCNECAKLIIQSGITSVVYLSHKYAHLPKWVASQTLLDMANVRCEQFFPERKNITLAFPT